MQIKIKILPLIVLILILAAGRSFTQNQSDGVPKVLKVIVMGSDTTAQNLLPEKKVQTKKQDVQAVSVIAGYMSGVYRHDGDEKKFLVNVNPVMLAPIGDKMLFQAELELEGAINRENDQLMQEWETKLETFQLAYFATNHLTVVGGAFLTPFGIYNERLHPKWIRNLLNKPLAHAYHFIPGTELGLMLRGGPNFAKNLKLNYSVYYSFQPSPGFWVEAERGVGGRISLFHTSTGLELGFSAYRKLVDEETNLLGIDLLFKYPRFPLGLRGEFVKSHEANVYWAELDYRFTNFPDAPDIITNTQLAVRVEQLFTTDEGMDEGMNNLNRLMIALNYYIIDGLKLNFEFGKTFNQDISTNTNLLTFGLVFRPAF